MAGRKDWPTIDEQLDGEGIRRGTALERLVREHQDFGMLRQEEADDRIRLPLWLRVYWRRQHPELEVRPGDPTGGYPRALWRLYQWMLANQDLPGEAGEASGGGPAR